MWTKRCRSFLGRKNDGGRNPGGELDAGTTAGRLQLGPLHSQGGGGPDPLPRRCPGAQGRDEHHHQAAQHPADAGAE
ncbi:hypothetical protein CEXT_235651 [Caerostris extrusa]|uniref:Uncharacterized protein n=1 Tax=Caerostris extrusa TaxID=172846 RepID=A0AAV4P250_CAEEX|nr:hypothetical protein CEXT_235651 [Caerostris extrusa]